MIVADAMALMSAERSVWSPLSFLDGRGDYLDAMPEAHFEVNLRKRVGIEREPYEKLDQVARQKNTTSERLVNEWVREKLNVEAADK